MYGSYNSHNSYNLPNSYNLHNSYDKGRLLKHIKKTIKIFFINFFQYIRFQQDIIRKTRKCFKKDLSKVSKYLWKNEKHLYGREECRNLSEEEKDKKHQCGCEPYKNLAEDEKLFQYRKKYSRMQKMKIGWSFYW